MRFVKVNYHLNQKFFVEEKAYEQMIQKTLKSFESKIEIQNLQIIAAEQNNSFRVALKVKKKSRHPYAMIIDEIQKEIEDKSQLLINAKPTNIEISFDHKE